MTEQYDHQGLIVPAFDGAEHYPIVDKWLHSVPQEPDFMTEWKASESAVSLAFELGQPTKLHRGSGLKRPTRLKTQNQVRFAPSAEVCIWDSQTRLVPLSALTCWPAKPWSLRPAKPWSLVSNWEGQPRHVLKKYRQLCFPPSWHSMVAFHFPKGTSSRGEVPVSQLRIMDEFVNLPHIPDDDGNGHLPGHVPNGQPPPQQPDFTHNMLAQMDPALATLANLQQQGVLVRTWYIHHETHMRNDIPRLVRLGADRHQWIQLIIDAWEGVIDVALPKAFTLPTPMPFRGPVVQFIALDIIVSQGLHIPRFSGLVSVHFQDDLDGLQAFVIAASFPPWVSGYHIVSAAEVHDYCSPISGRVCSIFHGWEAIPVDTQRLHHMRPGNSFMIQVPHDPNIEIGNTQAASSTLASADTHGMPGGTVQQHFDTGPDDDEQDGSGPEEPPSPGTPHDAPEPTGPLFNCHFYRLRHPPLHIFMRNAAGVPMLQELAHQMGVVPASLLHAHPLRALMTGERTDDWSFVLQSVTDLPAASSDMLVVIDVEVHFHPVHGTLQPVPAAARRVVRVPLHVTRSAVLGYAGVQTYCTAQNDRCLVQMNGVGWPILQPGPRVMQHGTYLRVIVPPPTDGTNSLQAIQVSESERQRMIVPMPAHSQAAGTAPSPAPLPVPGAPAPPAPAQVHGPLPLSSDWFSALQDVFAEQSLIEFEDEGPILYVWTWMINHASFKHCPAPRVVRLDELAHLWLTDIFEPWAVELQVDAPTQIRIVHARPPTDSFRIDTVHLMIEQHPTEARAAGVLSAVFHGPQNDRLLQAGHSLPCWLCTEDVIDIMQLNHICEAQVCRASIGRVPMEQFIRHDIPSAASIELHVRMPRCEGHKRAGSFGERFVPRTVLPTSAHSLMQISRRWHRRVRTSEADTPAPQDHFAGQHQVESPSFLNCVPPVPAVQPNFALPWPTTWRSLDDVWAFFGVEHATHFPDGISVEVWYSDHHRRPWSEAGRLVRLPMDFVQWVPAILQAWHDWLIPGVEVDIIVVAPTPIGGDNLAHFHVIIVQQPMNHQFSCILTVMDRFADPWVPNHVCVLLPHAVDHWALLHAAVVDFQCPPFDPGARCRTLYGNLELTAGNLFPVQHAMCFTITVETNGPLPMELPGTMPITLEQMPEHDMVLMLQTSLRMHVAFAAHSSSAVPSQDGGLDPVVPLDDGTCFRNQLALLHSAIASALQKIKDISCEPCPTITSTRIGEMPAHGPLPSRVADKKTTVPVVLSLDAVLIPGGDPDLPRYDDQLSTIAWLQDDNWAATCANADPFLCLLPTAGWTADSVGIIFCLGELRCCSTMLCCPMGAICGRSHIAHSCSMECCDCQG